MAGDEQPTLAQLSGLMSQLTVNVTGLTDGTQKLQTQVAATQAAQEKAEAELQKLSSQMVEQGQTLERLSTQMVGHCGSSYLR